MTGPAVSVVVPTYNRRNVLPRALDSIVAQTFHDWEIILVDDGSTDGTDKLAREYARRLGDRFVYLRQENTGCCSARNKGIEAGRGEFVAFLDSDDEYVPTKLQRQLDLFQLIPQLGFVYSDFSYIDLDGKKYDSVFDTQCPAAREVNSLSVGHNLCVCTGSLFDALIRSYFIATIVGVVRRDVLSDSIRFMRDPAYSEEWLFYLQVVRICASGFVDEPLCVHHHLPGSEARTDRHRNISRLNNLYHEMLNVLEPLTSAQRRVIKQNLATSSEQIGLNAYRTGSYRRASRYFFESFRRSPRLRRLGYLMHSLARWTLCRPPGHSYPSTVTQEAIHPVR